MAVIQVGNTYHSSSTTSTLTKEPDSGALSVFEKRLMISVSEMEAVRTQLDQLADTLFGVRPEAAPEQGIAVPPSNCKMLDFDRLCARIEGLASAMRDVRDRLVAL